MRYLPQSLAGLLLATFALATTGCLERSLVVKVNADGSGLVHLRSHKAEGPKFTLFGVRGDPSDEPESQRPSTEYVGQLTASLGKGAKLVSVEESVNRSAWSGYDVIWKFDDINQLVLPDTLLNAEDEEDEVEDEDSAEIDSDSRGKSKADKAKEEKKPSGFRFAYQNGTLEIRPYGDDPPKPAESDKQVGAVDPYADEPAAAGFSGSFGEAAAEQILAKALADMRVGVFVQVNGTIKETNAKHRRKNLITLVNLEVGKLLDSPETKRRFKEFGNRKPSRAELQELATAVEGLQLDLQNPIRVVVGD